MLGAAVGPSRLFPGAEFTMGMQQLGRRYRSLSLVVEYDEGRRLAWESVGVWRGHQIVGGQRWRWTLTPLPDGGTAVEHTYLWGYARLPLLTIWLPGYPTRARRTLPRSLSYLAAIPEREDVGSAVGQGLTRPTCSPPGARTAEPAADGSHPVRQRIEMMKTPCPLPWLVFDGDCAFCTTTATWLARRLQHPGRPDPWLVPWQQVDLGARGVSEKQAQHEVLWIAPTGEVSGGAAAVAAWLRYRGRPYGVIGRGMDLPIVRQAVARIYRVVARNRHRLPGGTPACAVTWPRPAEAQADQGSSSPG